MSIKESAFTIHNNTLNNGLHKIVRQLTEESRLTFLSVNLIYYHYDKIISLALACRDYNRTPSLC